MLTQGLSTFAVSPSFLRLFSTLKFAKTHEWVKLDGDVATIGVSDHAQKELGDIVFIELPKPDTSIKKGDTVATIETVKTVAGVFSPVNGNVIEGNQKLNENQKLLSTSPQQDGWIVKLKVNPDDAQREMEKLLDEEDYKKTL
ncbi:MAG: glycine cleavage system protein GcvH [archaeon]|nr:glycine cleavage system protein GcvH [archaeon]